MKKSVLIFIVLAVLIAGLNAAENVPDLKEILNNKLIRYWVKAGNAYNEGDYQEAIDNYRLGLQYDISNAVNIYNLACCYGLLGEAEEAQSYLIEQGFKELKKENFEGGHFIEKNALKNAQAWLGF